MGQVKQAVKVRYTYLMGRLARRSFSGAPSIPAFTRVDVIVPKHDTGLFFRLRSGQAALGMVLLIGGVIVLIAATMAFLVFSYLNSTFGYQASQKAYAVAVSGVDDGFMRLLRNKDFSSTGYTLPVGSSTATVSVTQNSPSANQATINSQATISFYSRRIRQIVEVNATSGEIIVLSRTLATFP